MVGKTVIFVDDDPNILQGLSRSLRPMSKSWSLVFAASGEEALTVLADRSVDVVVSDARMPEMDGPTLLAKVKDRYPHVLRIILSGELGEEMGSRAQEVAQAYIAKPCPPKQLQRAIERAHSNRVGE